MGEWRPIETASAVGKKRLLFWLKRGTAMVGFRVAGTRNMMSLEGTLYFATHWMPLPPPPEDNN